MTPLQVTLNVAARAASVIPSASGKTSTRLASDYTTDRDTIPAGQIGWQFQALPGAQPEENVDSNVNWQAAIPVRILVHYHLGAAEAESAWTYNQMQTLLAALMDPMGWRAVTGVMGLEQDPSADLDAVARDGDVVSFSVEFVFVNNEAA